MNERGFLCSPANPNLLFDGLEFRLDLSHGFVVDEVVKHETQSVERTLVTEQHVGVAR